MAPPLCVTVTEAATHRQSEEQIPRQSGQVGKCCPGQMAGDSRTKKKDGVLKTSRTKSSSGPRSCTVTSSPGLSMSTNVVIVVDHHRGLLGGVVCGAHTMHKVKVKNSPIVSHHDLSNVSIRHTTNCKP